MGRAAEPGPCAALRCSVRFCSLCGRIPPFAERKGCGMGGAVMEDGGTVEGKRTLAGRRAGAGVLARRIVVLVECGGGGIKIAVTD